MSKAREIVDETKAQVHPTRNGWLAASRPGSRLVVGVVAQSEDEASQEFQREVTAWLPLLQDAEEKGDLRA